MAEAEVRGEIDQRDQREHGDRLERRLREDELAAACQLENFYLPPATGLSHADGTRVATMSDSARSEVDALRARVNEAVTKRLEPAIRSAGDRRREDGGSFDAARRRVVLNG